MEYTTAIRYDLERSHGCPLTQLFVAFCCLGQGYFLLALASLIFFTLYLFRLSFDSPPPWSATEVGRYRVSLSLSLSHNQYRRSLCGKAWEILVHLVHGGRR